MSFSSRTKDEVCKQRLKNQRERMAFLCAVTCAAGSMSLSKEGVGVVYVTENHNTAKRIASAAAAIYDVVASVSVTEHERLGARNITVRLAGQDCRRLLEDSGLISDEAHFLETAAALTQDKNGNLGFLQGAFLGCGSVAAPSKGYHLELVCKREAFALILTQLLNGWEFNARTVERKGSYVVYMKEGERISDFLTLLGAMSSTMEFEHARIIREVTGNANRLRNADSANMDKCARASAAQRIDIQLIQREKGLGFLPARLRETAELRLNYPEATLAELSELSGVGKSGMNHRLAKLSKIAAELRLEKGKPVEKETE